MVHPRIGNVCVINFLVFYFDDIVQKHTIHLNYNVLVRLKLCAHYICI